MTNLFWENLDDTLPGRLKELKLPGVAIARIENGEIASTHTHGFADITSQKPVTEETLFQIASISKSVSSWGVMKLVESGRVDLDAPISRYISRYVLPDSEFDANEVTVRRLMCHTAGISHSGFQGVNPKYKLPSLEQLLCGDIPPQDEFQKSCSAAQDQGAGAREERTPVHIKYRPGETHRYSGGGTTLLELMIEEVSAQTFPEFMQENILNPLGMKNSSFSPDKLDANNVATAYDPELDALPFYGFAAKVAAGLNCNIIELGKFACAEMVGAKDEPPGRGVLTPESITTLLSRETFAETFGETDMYVSPGHFLLEIGGKKVVQHTGGNTGWRTVYTIIPELKKGQVILINSQNGNDLWMPLLREWIASIFPNG